MAGKSQDDLSACGHAQAGVAGIIERYSGDPGMLIPMMQDIQAGEGYLPREELKELARGLGVPLSRIYSIATFYAAFRLMPKGDHTVQLCMGTVCFLKGAGKMSETIQKEFGLVPGATSADGKFTFAPVNCVGACALAPVMVVDGEYHGGLTVDSAVEILHRIAEGGGAEAPVAPGPAASDGPSAEKKGRAGSTTVKYTAEDRPDAKKRAKKKGK